MDFLAEHDANLRRVPVLARDVLNHVSQDFEKTFFLLVDHQSIILLRDVKTRGEMLNVLKFWGVRLFENKPAFFHITQSEYENIIVLWTYELVCRWMLDLKLSEGFDSVSFVNEATVNWTLE